MQLNRYANRITVYPRVGGGNDFASREAYLDRGLSPRGRGKLRELECERALWRSIPAWAGETLCLPEICRAMGVYPRVGGGN